MQSARASLAAGMALALVGRTVALVPTAASTIRYAKRGGPFMRLGAIAAPAAVRAMSTRRRHWGVPVAATASLVAYANGGSHLRWSSSCRAGARARVGMMCSTSTSTTDVEVSAEGLEIGASIKAKGDAIRDLKAGGVSKDELKPHIEELLELKQLYVKATGTAFGPPPSDKKAKKGKGKAPASGGGGGGGQPKQMDTRKADKAKKAEQARLAAEARDLEILKGLEPVLYPSKEQLEAGVGEPSQRIGDYSLTRSEHETGRVFSSVKDLGAPEGVPAGQEVWIRGRVHQVRGKGGSAFLVVRQDTASTVQAVHFKDKENVADSKRMIKFVGTLPLESIVDVKGLLVEANVKSCTQNNVEIKIDRVYAVSRASLFLPFSVEDAARSEEEVEASQETGRPFPRLGQDLRLDNRWLDLRTPANNAIMTLQSGVCQLFRESLYAQGFMEIHTPKIIPGESEGGAGVFTTDYFGKQACLAQSPQLYKQMAISADMGRVFEVGPVFRAENSNTRRHLTEFNGLDLEMSITDHYNEVILVLHNTFKSIFSGLEERYKDQLDAVRLQYPSTAVRVTEEPLVVHWEDGIQMLRDAGHEANDFDDLSGAQELALGELVAEKFGSDFFFLDRFPTQIRPFYTMPCPDDKRYSNSYDLILRGQEICSGAQRCHDADMLMQILDEKGVPAEPLSDYINAFRHGCPPHGGGGVGLERIVFLYLGLDNIRKASMFPRDPSRCSP
ncbi:unnamed protein product [Ectocarpus sp. 4 AP-2014]